MKTYTTTILNRNDDSQTFSVHEYDDHIALIAYLSDTLAYVDIPAHISGKPVTVIGADCFFQHEEITDICFPETMTTIKTQAFALCKGIKELTFPDSISEIESYAFRDCTGLRKIILPAGLKTLRQGVFAYTYLPDDAEITLNEGLEKIQSKVFSSGGLNLFFTLKIPESVRECAADAFEPGITIIPSPTHITRMVTPETTSP